MAIVHCHGISNEFSITYKDINKYKLAKLTTRGRRESCFHVKGIVLLMCCTLIFQLKGHMAVDVCVVCSHKSLLFRLCL